MAGLVDGPASLLTIEEYPPSASLRPYVSRYSTLVAAAGRLTADAGRGSTRSSRVPTDHPLFGSLFPNGDLNIVIECGDWLDGRGGLDLPGAASPALAVGAITRPVRTNLDERVQLISVTFRPGRARRLLPVAAHALTDRAVPLADLWSGAGANLAERLQELPSMEQRVRFLDGTLRARLARGTGRDFALAGILDEATARRGRLTVASLAERAGTTRQTLARRFREEVGVSPKFYLRLVRFHHALRLLSSGAIGDLGRAAVRLGYYDQSHMTAEFGTLAGCTPGRFRAEC